MVVILCEGIGDQKFLSKLLRYMKIPHTKGNFFLMYGKANFFKSEYIAYKKIALSLVENEIHKLLFVLDADYEEKDEKQGGYDNCLREIKQFIKDQGWTSISDVFIMCDPKKKTGNHESLILSTIPKAPRQCIDDFLTCSEFQKKDEDKEIVRKMYKLQYPTLVCNFNHENFTELKKKLEKLFS